MTTWRVASDLAAVLVPVAFIGAAIAALCALVAAIAITRGAAGLTGGGTAMWMPFALVAALGSFASEWVPLLIAGGSLAAMLVLGGVGRAVVASARRSGRTVPTSDAVGAVVAGAAAAAASAGETTATSAERASRPASVAIASPAA